MRLSLPRAALALLLAAAGAPPAAALGPRDQLLVSPAWLRAHLQDRNLVLLHIGNRAQYDSAHIPGARFIELGMIGRDPESKLSLQLPPVRVLDSVFGSLGVTPDSRIVLYYGQDWVSPTTRVWFTLEYLGLGRRASLLDGGMPAWRALGYPVTADAPPAVQPGRPLASRARPELVAQADWLSQAIGGGRVVVVDARDRGFYRGLESTSDPRPGHLPGAHSLPYHSFFGDDLRFLPDSALRQRFRELGAGGGKEVVAYCHVGQQATVVVFAARLAGLNARLYDGSFQEWSARDDLPVEGAVPATRGTLISTDELARRLERGEPLTVVDARGDLAAYFANHLPGAAYLHYETLRATRGGVPADTLSADGYAGLLGRLGVRRDRPVVVYGSGDAGNFNATFFLWVLAGFRHPEVYLLDGGYTKWSAEGRAVTRKYPGAEAAAYDPDPYAIEIADREWVHHVTEHTAMRAVIVDVRPLDQYTGAAGAQLRRGHIPTAVHHFWQDDLITVDGVKVWKPVETLRAAYEAQGITPDKWVLLYCNTGTEASHAWFALRQLLGYPRVRVYVPGWTEWSEAEDLPIEQGERAASR